MITKLVKRTVVVAAGVAIVGGVLFGRDVASYVRSSAKSVRTVVKGSVPIEFELRRAQDLLEDIIPEMHANIKLISQDEVEVAALQTEIAKAEVSIEEEQARVATLREALKRPQARYTFAGQEYPRSYVREDLSSRFARLKDSEDVLAGKRRLLATREKSLHSAMQLLERTRGRKRALRDQIASLASQHKLVKAASIGSKFQVDNSKLAQTEKLIAQIQKRLDVAERVLAHESQFVQAIPVDAVPEEDLFTQVDEYLQSKQQMASAEPQQLLDN